MTKRVDLRSDTVTRPVPGMRTAIAEAVVGDDVFEDDPTVQLLEQRVAELLGTEAALFVPSGTMANLVALSSITVPGDEVIIDRQSHVFNYEVASAAALSGLQFNPIDCERGIVTAQAAESLIRTANIHHPITRCISLENTHNRAGGCVFPLEEMQKVRELADRYHLKVHLDGARLANAVVASGVDFRSYASCAHTVSMCFSKGLGAPIGSAVASDADTVLIARRKRKQLGGGMRQVGLLAAGALYALDHHTERLATDHANAQKLASFADGVEGLDVAFPVETNIVIFRVHPQRMSVPDLLARLEEMNVLAVPFGAGLMRMVTHLDVDERDIDSAGKCLRQAMG